MTFINRNQIILLLSFIFLLGISYFLSITFGENLAREKKISKKIITDEDPIQIEKKLNHDEIIIYNNCGHAYKDRKIIKDKIGYFPS